MRLIAFLLSSLRRLATESRTRSRWEEAVFTGRLVPRSFGYR
jgi:hypothetical protein